MPNTPTIASVTASAANAATITARNRCRPVAAHSTSSSVVIVATMPESRFTRTGVPVRAEICPSHSGPAASKHEVASARSAPPIHAPADEASARMNATATMSPSTSPTPVRVTSPLAATEPP